MTSPTKFYVFGAILFAIFLATILFWSPSRPTVLLEPICQSRNVNGGTVHLCREGR